MTGKTTPPRPKPSRGIRDLVCACCGSPAGRWEQWHNQDKGHGLCARCAAWITEREADKPHAFRTDLVRVYGVPGVHREPVP